MDDQLLITLRHTCAILIKKIIKCGSVPPNIPKNVGKKKMLLMIVGKIGCFSF